MTGVLPAANLDVLLPGRLDGYDVKTVECRGPLAPIRQKRPSNGVSVRPRVLEAPRATTESEDSTAPPDDGSRQVVKAHSLFFEPVPRRLFVDRRKRARVSSSTLRHIAALRLDAAVFKFAGAYFTGEEIERARYARSFADAGMVAPL
jgi:hypothetical protein